MIKHFVSSDGCSERECWVDRNPVFIYLLEHPFFFGERIQRIIQASTTAPLEVWVPPLIAGVNIPISLFELLPRRINGANLRKRRVSSTISFLLWAWGSGSQTGGQATMVTSSGTSSATLVSSYRVPIFS